MRKPLLLLLLLLLPLCALGEPARDVTRECAFYMPMRKADGRYLYDRNAQTNTYSEVYRNPYITVTPGETPVAAVRVDLGRNVMPFEVQVKRGGEWVTVAQSNGGDYAQLYAEFAPLSEPFRLTFPSGEWTRTLSVRELYCYSAGEREESAVPVWQPVCTKSDLMFIAAHPDDELLWFGGALPRYAGEEGRSVQVVYATCSKEWRRIELLSGLWHCGVRNYPVIGDFEDFQDPSVDVIFANWGRKNFLTFLVRQLRTCRPEVVVTQDAQGEYGHTQHIALVQAVQEALPLAADPAFDPESAAAQGVWQVKKLYLHLGDAPTLRLDTAPLSTFGGKTGIDVAREALTFHASQNLEKFQVAALGDPYDSTLYTLVYSAVGADEAGNDFLEHLR